MAKLDLDVDTPEKALEVLGRAVDAFYESAVDLEASWQDKSAGRPWRIIAKEIEAAIARIERKL